MKKSFEISSALRLLTLVVFFDVIYQGAKQFDPASNSFFLFSLRITGIIFATIFLLVISWYLRGNLLVV